MNLKVTSLSLLALAIAHPTLAQDALETIETLETVTVLGDEEEQLTLPGSGYYIGQEEIQERNITNINRLLAEVPGVYVREEDGSGNFPNISLRGGDGTRSEKVTVMEDGILTAPSPYSAPAAYYSPRAARMAGIEVLKGSSQVKYGPQTTGGVINYLSTPIPDEQKFYSRNTIGTNDTWLSHNYFGNTVETSAGDFGFLFEVFHHSSTGFRKIDSATGYDGSDETGFDATEPMIKFFWEPNSAVKQRFEFKYGFTDFEADESYVGLSEFDVRNSPDRRYAATRFDNIDTEQHRTYLKYLIQPTDGLTLEAAIYYNKFERNWRKLDDISAPGGIGNVRSAFFTPEGLAALQGLGEGTLTVRNNNREYEAYGIQLNGQAVFETGALEHELEFGVRLHADDVRRFQGDEFYTQDATGAIVNEDIRAFGTQGNRLQESEAVAVYLQDKISIGDFMIRPGARYEYIDQTWTEFERDITSPNFNTPTSRNTGSENFFAPGVSFTYNFTDEDVLFGGLHKGFSVAGPRASIRGVEPEESLGYELGFRHREEGLQAELVGFFTDFDNLIATDAGLGSANSANVGEAEVWGFEGLLRYDPLVDSEYHLPMYLSATWTSAELKTTLTSGGGDNIYAGARPGSDIPYVPELKLAFGIGIEHESWGVRLDGTYLTETFGTAANQENPTTNARLGRIDDLLIFDTTGHLQVSENLKLIGGLQNLFDERGIVSRVPRGPRANNGRTAFIGFEAEF